VPIETANIAKVMNMLNRLSAQFDFHGDALKLRSERQRVIASNIANADTPGFAARDIDFRAALSNATKSDSGVANASSTKSATSLSATNSSHVSVPTLALSSRGETPLLYRQSLQGGMDANSVDMDIERANFADNSVRYEASLRFLNGQIKTMNLAVTGQ
jgi:flagellar basal-body rod protein FlgB